MELWYTGLVIVSLSFVLVLGLFSFFERLSHLNASVVNREVGGQISYDDVIDDIVQQGRPEGLHCNP